MMVDDDDNDDGAFRYKYNVSCHQYLAITPFTITSFTVTVTGYGPHGGSITATHPDSHLSYMSPHENGLMRMVKGKR